MNFFHKYANGKNTHGQVQRKIFEQLGDTTSLDGVDYPTADAALGTLLQVRQGDLLIHLSVHDMRKKQVPAESKQK